MRHTSETKSFNTRHVDSPASFTGVVAMVSLLESWEMQFRKRRENTKVVRLGRRSATILEGEARYNGRTRYLSAKPSLVPLNRAKRDQAEFLVIAGFRLPFER